MPAELSIIEIFRTEAEISCTWAYKPAFPHLFVRMKDQAGEPTNRNELV